MLILTVVDKRTADIRARWMKKIGREPWPAELAAELSGPLVCPRCGTPTYHPDDIATGYCIVCHWWTSDPRLGDPEVIAMAEAEGAIEPVETHADVFGRGAPEGQREHLHRPLRWLGRRS